ncbi:MAG: hypothetical protein U0935_22260 [Pirellulales bacterium]
MSGVAGPLRPWMRWKGLATIAGLILGGCHSAADVPDGLPPSSIPYDRLPARDWPAAQPLPARWTPPLAGYQLAARKEAESGQLFPLRLADRLVMRWRLARDPRPDDAGGAGTAGAATGPGAGVDDWRVEVRLVPRSLPKWRLVGSSLLQASRDTTWLEFVETKADQVLKLKLECCWTDRLELAVTPFFQLAPTAQPLPLTPAHRQRAEQLTVLTGQRLTTQLQWLAARSGGGGKGGGGSGGGGTAQATAWRKQLEQQLKIVQAARERLAHLDQLQQTLQQEGRLQVRLLSFSTGEEIPLAPGEPA